MDEFIYINTSSTGKPRQGDIVMTKGQQCVVLDFNNGLYLVENQEDEQFQVTINEIEEICEF